MYCRIPIPYACKGATKWASASTVMRWTTASASLESPALLKSAKICAKALPTVITLAGGLMEQLMDHAFCTTQLAW